MNTLPQRDLGKERKIMSIVKKLILDALKFELVIERSGHVLEFLIT